VVDLAARHDPRVITLGRLLFFSTASGDAWMLDPEDGHARCVARGGEPLPTGVRETLESFAIQWNEKYRIDGDAMVFTDSSGHERVVLGYPTSEIAQAVKRTKRSQ
jgi:hypothetical protein